MTAARIGDYVKSHEGAGQPRIEGVVVAVERDRCRIRRYDGSLRWRSLKNVTVLQRHELEPGHPAWSHYVTRED